MLEITSTDVAVNGATPVPFWKFWLRSDATRLYQRALESVPMPDNLDLLEDAWRNPGFQPQKRYADWNIDFDQFLDGEWHIDTSNNDVRWPVLRRNSDQSAVQMSWEDFFLSVPGRGAILERLKNSGAPAYYEKFINTRPLKSTLSVPEQDFNNMMMEYVTTPKKSRADVVNRLLDSQWVLSQDLEQPLSELRVRLMEH